MQPDATGPKATTPNHDRNPPQVARDSLLEGDGLELPVSSLRAAIHPIKRLLNHGLVPVAVPCLDIGLDLLEEVSVGPLLRGKVLGTEARTSR